MLLSLYTTKITRRSDPSRFALRPISIFDNLNFCRVQSASIHIASPGFSKLLEATQALEAQEEAAVVSVSGPPASSRPAVASLSLSFFPPADGLSDAKFHLEKMSDSQELSQAELLLLQGPLLGSTESLVEEKNADPKAVIPLESTTKLRRD
jgi:hypothetical protein